MFDITFSTNTIPSTECEPYCGEKINEFMEQGSYR